MRRSAVCAELARRGDVAGLGRDAGERVEGEDLDVGVVVAPGVVEDRDEPFLGAGDADPPASMAASRHSPSAACSPPPAARCHAVAASSAARACSRRPSARSTRPRCTRASAARRTSPVASALSIASSRVAAPAS